MNRNHQQRAKSVKTRVRQVRQDMLKDPSLSLTRHLAGAELTPARYAITTQAGFERTFLDELELTPPPENRRLYIPWFEPGELMPIPTKTKKERLLLGRWMAALNAAGHGDFSKIDKFPKNKRIGGVLLPTNQCRIHRFS